MFAKLLSFLGLSKNRVTDEEWDEEELQQIQRVYKEAISSDIEAIDHVDVFVNNLLVNNSLIPFPDWPSYGVTLKLIRKVYSEKRSHSLSILNATTVDIRLLNESPTLVAFFRSYPDANYKDHNLASKIVVQADGVIVPIEDWSKHLVTVDDLKQVARSGKTKEYHDKEWITVSLKDPAK